jgi:hypothetical protein
MIELGCPAGQAGKPQRHLDGHCGLAAEHGMKCGPRYLRPAGGFSDRHLDVLFENRASARQDAPAAVAMDGALDIPGGVSAC